MKTVTGKMRMLFVGVAAGLMLGIAGTAGAAIALRSHAVNACSTGSGVLKLERRERVVSLGQFTRHDRCKR